MPSKKRRNSVRGGYVLYPSQEELDQARASIEAEKQGQELADFQNLPEASKDILIRQRAADMFGPSGKFKKVFGEGYIFTPSTEQLLKAEIAVKRQVGEKQFKRLPYAQRSALINDKAAELYGPVGRAGRGIKKLGRKIGEAKETFQEERVLKQVYKGREEFQQSICEDSLASAEKKMRGLYGQGRLTETQVQELQNMKRFVDAIPICGAPPNYEINKQCYLDPERYGTPECQTRQRIGLGPLSLAVGETTELYPLPQQKKLKEIRQGRADLNAVETREARELAEAIENELNEDSNIQRAIDAVKQWVQSGFQQLPAPSTVGAGGVAILAALAGLVYTFGPMIMGAQAGNNLALPMNGGQVSLPDIPAAGPNESAENYFNRMIVYINDLISEAGVTAGLLALLKLVLYVSNTPAGRQGLKRFVEVYGGIQAASVEQNASIAKSLQSAQNTGSFVSARSTDTGSLRSLGLRGGRKCSY
jgi:hypothetical protein